MELTNIFGEDIDNIQGVFGAVSYGEYPCIDVIDKSRSNPLGIDPMCRFFINLLSGKMKVNIDILFLFVMGMIDISLLIMVC